MLHCYTPIAFSYCIFETDMNEIVTRKKRVNLFSLSLSSTVWAISLHCTSYGVSVNKKTL